MKTESERVREPETLRNFKSFFFYSSLVQKKKIFKWCTLHKVFHNKDKVAQSRKENGERKYGGESEGKGQVEGIVRKLEGGRLLYAMLTSCLHTASKLKHSTNVHT